MKTTFYITVIFILYFLLIYCCFAQARDSLLQLTPEIGDTINLSEKNYYNLYPNIQGFQYATVYFRDDSIAVSRITYLNGDGTQKDTILTNRGFYIGNLRAHIRQIDNDNLAFQKRAEELKQIKSLEDISRITTLATVTTKDGYAYKGWLWSVKEDSIFIIPDTIITKSDLDIINNYLTFTSEDIKSVFIEGKDNIGISLGLGSLIGVALGVGIGFASGDDPPGHIGSLTAGQKASISGIAFGLAGGIIGLVIGLVSSTGDETFEINSTSDLEILKDYLVK